MEDRLCPNVRCVLRRGQNMPESTQDHPAPPAKPRGYTTFESLRRLELKNSLRTIRRLNRGRRRQERLAKLVLLWPVAAGLLLGALSPWLYSLASVFGVWGQWLLFPFAVLAARPEIYVDETLAHWLPVVMLYAQFPIEGVLIRIALRKRVTAGGALRELVFFHLLGASELWLLSGSLGQMLTH